MNRSPSRLSFEYPGSAGGLDLGTFSNWNFAKEELFVFLKRFVVVLIAFMNSLVGTEPKEKRFRMLSVNFEVHG